MLWTMHSICVSLYTISHRGLEVHRVMEGFSEHDFIVSILCNTTGILAKFTRSRSAFCSWVPWLPQSAETALCVKSAAELIKRNSHFLSFSRHHGVSDNATTVAFSLLSLHSKPHHKASFSCYHCQKHQAEKLVIDVLSRTSNNIT